MVMAYLLLPFGGNTFQTMLHWNLHQPYKISSTYKKNNWLDSSMTFFLDWIPSNNSTMFPVDFIERCRNQYFVYFINVCVSLCGCCWFDAKNVSWGLIMNSWYGSDLPRYTATSELWSDSALWRLQKIYHSGKNLLHHLRQRQWQKKQYVALPWCSSDASLARNVGHQLFFW